MPRPFCHLRQLACLLALVAPAVVAQTGAFPPITDARLRNPEPGDWLSYRRTDDVTAYSPLTDVNRRTVRELSVIWSYSMRDDSRWVATPIVANGLMYLSEGSGRVVALNAVTGELVWSATRNFPDDIAASEAYPRHRGVSIYGDTIYWGTADSFLVALDARTGEKRWETQTADYRDGEGHAHPPLIADGKVFIGMAGGDFAARGSLKALDATTGEILWTFYTIPGRDDPGAETWDWNAAFPPAGAATWNTISHDPELGLVYVSTGNPSPAEPQSMPERSWLRIVSSLFFSGSSSRNGRSIQVVEDSSVHGPPIASSFCSSGRYAARKTCWTAGVGLSGNSGKSSCD